MTKDKHRGYYIEVLVGPNIHIKFQITSLEEKEENKFNEISNIINFLRKQSLARCAYCPTISLWEILIINSQSELFFHVFLICEIREICNNWICLSDVHSYSPWIQYHRGYNSKYLLLFAIQSLNIFRDQNNLKISHITYCVELKHISPD